MHAEVQQPVIIVCALSSFTPRSGTACCACHDDTSFVPLPRQEAYKEVDEVKARVCAHSATANALLQQAFQCRTANFTADMLARQEACPCLRWPGVLYVDEDLASAEDTLQQLTVAGQCAHMQ